LTERNRLTVLAIAAVAAGIALTAGPAATADAMGTSPAGHWGNAQKVPGMAALNPDGNGGIQSISCDKPGECAAGGFTVGDSVTHDHLFHDVLAVERGGTWRQARRVYGTDPAVKSSLINSVSCADGSCAAGGWFTRSDGNEHAFVVSEANGTIGTPLEVPGTPLNSGSVASVLAVSCAAAGACAAGGHSVKDGDEEPFVVDETGGGWGTAKPLQNMDKLNKIGRGIVTAISCGAPGDCVAAGTYGDNQRVIHAFAAEEASGNWGPAEPLPGLDKLTTGESEPMSVSCSGPGNCAIAGFYDSSDFKQRQAFVLDEHGGSWGSAQQVPGTANRNTNHFATINSISCTAAGECGAVGYYSTPDGRHQFVSEERGGTWQPAIRDLTRKGSPSDGFAVEANAVSCGSPGNCVVTGEFADAKNGSHLFTLNEAGGTWGKIRELPGSAKLNVKKFGRLLTVSCASAGNCAVGGFYEDAKGRTQGVVADSSTVTAAHLSLSAATVRYGHEQDEKISVSVTSRTGGRPGGRVIVATQQGTLCVITLANGKGGCTLTAKKLPVGSYTARASYAAGNTYAGSASGTKSLTVTT
jgi:hypothetical protein